MEIINKTKSHSTFNNLEDGDVFMFEDVPYMRINKHHYGNDVIAIDLRNGRTVMIESIMHGKWNDIGVNPVDASLMVTNKGE